MAAIFSKWPPLNTQKYLISGNKHQNWHTYSFPAHHASQRRGKPFEVSISSLLPLLRDQAHSVATVKHVMDKIREIVAFLNPSQVPIIAADQPIYAVAKKVQ